MNKGLCPLKHITAKRDINETTVFFDFCSGEICEWYIKETGECAIKCIATRLERGAVHVIWEKTSGTVP